MKRAVFITVVIIFFVITGGCNDEEIIKSHWNHQTIAIDSDIADWQSMPFYSFEEPNVFMSVSNDDENLYVLIGFNDRVLSRRFLRTGATLWFDREAKKGKNFGIRIPGGPFSGNSFGREANKAGESAEKQQAVQDVILKNKLNEMMSSITVVSVKDDETNTFIKPDGVLGAYNVENDVYRFEFQIPLQIEGTLSYAIAEPPENFFGFGLEIGAIPPEELEAMKKRRSEMGEEMGRGGRGGGGRGGMGGRGGGRGGPGGGMGGRDGMQMPGKQEAWVKVFLASPKDN